jgi:hypothetical protein
MKAPRPADMSAVATSPCFQTGAASHPSAAFLDQTLAVMERFNAALERHDIEGMLAMAETPSSKVPAQRRKGRAGDRCVVRWRYDWGKGHVRGVDVIRLRDGLIAETYSYVQW